MVEEDSEGRCQSTVGRLELDDEQTFQRDHLGDHLGLCQLFDLHSWQICSSMGIRTLGCDETCFLVRGCATNRRGVLSDHFRRVDSSPCVLKM